MSDPARSAHGEAMRRHLAWMVRLRWAAGGAIVAGVLLERHWLGWYDLPSALLAVGLLVLAYNAVFFLILARQAVRPGRGRVLAYLQIALDLACLMVLVVHTGALASPLLGLSFLHMVFASLLLTRAAAYAGAAGAMLLMVLALMLAGPWPLGHGQTLQLVGWSLALVLTVYLANHLTASLRRHRRRLIVRNRRIRHLLRRLQEQQLAMVQHEKAAAMGRMAAGLAHEIANPLASMDSVLQLMQRSGQPLSGERIATLREQVDRIKRTLRQVTDFAHPTEYEWRSVGLNDLMESGLQMVRFDHRLRRIQLQIEQAPDNPSVHVQPHAVQQALTNILLNAIDALAEVPDPTLTVRAAMQGRRPIIEVIDNGPGIPEAHSRDIFDPFFTTKPVGKGTGLGLAISRTLLEDQGGDIQWQQTPGGGATFAVILPRQRAESKAAARRPPGVSPAQASVPSVDRGGAPDSQV